MAVAYALDNFFGSEVNGGRNSLIRVLGPGQPFLYDTEKDFIQDALLREDVTVMLTFFARAYYNYTNEKNFKDLGKVKRFTVNDNNMVVPSKLSARAIMSPPYQFEPFHVYVGKLKNLLAGFAEGQPYVTRVVIKAFRDRFGSESQQPEHQIKRCHPVRVSFYIFAGIYHDWVIAGKPSDRGFFTKMMVQCFENSQLLVRLFQCFRGAADVPPSTDVEILEAIAAEGTTLCEDLPEDPADEDGDDVAHGEAEEDEAMDVEVEHVHTEACNDYEGVCQQSTEAIFAKNPQLKAAVEALLKKRQINDGESSDDAEEASSGEGSKTPVDLSDDEDTEIPEEKQKEIIAASNVAYLAMLYQQEKAGDRLRCPHVICKKREDYVDGSNYGFRVVGDRAPIRSCPECNQVYHTFCRKHKDVKSLCVKCGHQGDEAAEDQTEAEEADMDLEDVFEELIEQRE